MAKYSPARRSLFMCVLLLNQFLVDHALSTNATRNSSVQSCAGKCGQIQQVPCSCDLKCVVHNNCCEDMQEQCPDVIEESKTVYKKHLSAEVRCVNGVFTITSCAKLREEEKTVFPVSSGNVSSEATTTSISAVERTRDLPEAARVLLNFVARAPVIDISTGFVYLNTDIFMCFATWKSHTAVWQTRFHMLSTENPKSLKDFSKSVDFTVPPVYAPPLASDEALQGAVCVPREQYLGNESCHYKTDDLTIDADWKKKCGSFFSYVETPETIFKNIYCAYCNFGENIRVQPMTDFKDFRHKHIFSVVVSLEDDNLELSFDVFHEKYKSPWRKASCNMSSPEASSDLGCEIYDCSEGFSLRPSGKCSKLYEAVLAFPEDDFPLSKEQFDYFPVFFLCHLKDVFDIPQRVEANPVALYHDNMKRYFGFKFPLYSPIDEIFAIKEENANFFLKFSSSAKIFKYYMSQNFSTKPSGELKHDFKCDNDVGFSAQFVYKEGLYSTIMPDRGTPVQGNNITLCFCDIVDEIKFCNLICATDQVYEEDFTNLRNLAADPCLARFRALTSHAGSDLAILQAVYYATAFLLVIVWTMLHKSM